MEVLLGQRVTDITEAGVRAGGQLIGFEGRFQRFNPAWTHLLGWTVEELLGKEWMELIHPEDREEVKRNFEAMKAGQSESRFELRCRKSNGTYQWFSCGALARPETQSIYGFFRDVTEERRLADQVRQSQKMEAVGQLASGVAHDFNNLLTVITSYVDLLLEARERGGELDLEMLGEIQAAARRAAELTSQLLAFSRKAAVRPQTLCPNAMVNSCLRLLTRVIACWWRTSPGCATSFARSSSLSDTPSSWPPTDGKLSRWRERTRSQSIC